MNKKIVLMMLCMVFMFLLVPGVFGIEPTLNSIEINEIAGSYAFGQNITISSINLSCNAAQCRFICYPTSYTTEILYGPMMNNDTEISMELISWKTGENPYTCYVNNLNNENSSTKTITPTINSSLCAINPKKTRTDTIKPGFLIYESITLCKDGGWEIPVGTYRTSNDGLFAFYDNNIEFDCQGVTLPDVTRTHQNMRYFLSNGNYLTNLINCNTTNENAVYDLYGLMGVKIENNQNIDMGKGNWGAMFKSFQGRDIYLYNVSQKTHTANCNEFSSMQGQDAQVYKSSFVCSKWTMDTTVSSGSTFNYTFYYNNMTNAEMRVTGYTNDFTKGFASGKGPQIKYNNFKNLIVVYLRTDYDFDNDSIKYNNIIQGRNISLTYSNVKEYNFDFNYWGECDDIDNNGFCDSIKDGSCATGDCSNITDNCPFSSPCYDTDNNGVCDDATDVFKNETANGGTCYLIKNNIPYYSGSISNITVNYLDYSSILIGDNYNILDDDGDDLNCSLYINNTKVYNWTSISNNTELNYTYTSLPKHTTLPYYYNCTDGEDTNVSDTKYLIYQNTPCRFYNTEPTSSYFNYNLVTDQSDYNVYTYIGDYDGDKVESWVYYDGVEHSYSIPYTPPYIAEGFINLTKYATHNITYVCNDGFSATNTTLLVQLTYQNRAPYFDPALQNQDLLDNATLSYQVTCLDYDNDTITYYINTTDSDMAIDSNTGVITDNTITATDVTVICSDGLINTTDSFRVSINQASATSGGVSNLGLALVVLGMIFIYLILSMKLNTWFPELSYMCYLLVIGLMIWLGYFAILLLEYGYTQSWAEYSSLRNHLSLLYRIVLYSNFLIIVMSTLIFLFKDIIRRIVSNKKK